MEDYIIYNEMMDVYRQQLDIIQEGEIMDNAIKRY